MRQYTVNDPEVTCLSHEEHTCIVRDGMVELPPAEWVNDLMARGIISPAPVVKKAANEPQKNNDTAAGNTNDDRVRGRRG